MRAAAAATGLMAGAALLLAATAGPGIERPPPGYTGGFGEPTCTACHLPAAATADSGRVSVDDLPSGFAPGVTYRVTITLTQPGLGAGGIQLTARFDDGAQAGGLFMLPEDSMRIAVTPHAGVLYAHHEYPGTRRTAPDSIRWTVLWTAPRRASAVTFHVAANAADDDESPLGDVIYSTAHRVLPLDSATAIVPRGRFP